MLLLRNVSFVFIVQLNFLFSFFNVFFIIIQKVTYLVATKNSKNTKNHKIFYLHCLV